MEINLGGKSCLFLLSADEVVNKHTTIKMRAKGFWGALLEIGCGRISLVVWSMTTNEFKIQFFLMIRYLIGTKRLIISIHLFENVLDIVNLRTANYLDMMWALWCHYFIWSSWVVTCRKVIFFWRNCRSTSIFEALKDSIVNCCLRPFWNFYFLNGRTCP